MSTRRRFLTEREKSCLMWGRDVGESRSTLYGLGIGEGVTFMPMVVMATADLDVLAVYLETFEVWRWKGRALGKPRAKKARRKR